ncbi:hypothetical protein ACQKEK_03350 [Pseudomonas sp. NPDC077408]
MTCVACGYQPTVKNVPNSPMRARVASQNHGGRLCRRRRRIVSRAWLKRRLGRGVADRMRFATGFADAMDDLEAMNDPRNTAQSVAAAHEKRRASPGLVRVMSDWVLSRWPAKKESDGSSAKRDMTPQEEATQLSEAVTHAFDQVDAVVHAYQQSRPPVTTSMPEPTPEALAQTASKAS